MREGSNYPGVEHRKKARTGSLYYASLFGEEATARGDPPDHLRTRTPEARLKADPPFGLYDGSGKFETTARRGRIQRPQRRTARHTNGTWTETAASRRGGGETQDVELHRRPNTKREGKGESPNRAVTVRVEDDEEPQQRRPDHALPRRQTADADDHQPEPSLHTWKVGRPNQLRRVGSTASNSATKSTSNRALLLETRLAPLPRTGPNDCHEHPLQVFAGVIRRRTDRPRTRLSLLHRNHPPGHRRTRPRGDARRCRSTPARST